MGENNSIKKVDHRQEYFNVWMSLLGLTVVTVAASYIQFGVLNIFIAMAIASVKAVLVCLYFMHLKYDNRVNQVVFAAAFFFLIIFVGLTLSDVLFRPSIKAISHSESS